MRRLIDTAARPDVPDPGPAYWDGYWERLQSRLVRDVGSPARPVFSRPRRWALPAAAAVMAGLALIVGLSRLRPPRPAEPMAAAAPASDLDARTGRYFDRSRLILLALAKETPPGQDVFALDLPGRKTAARALAGEGAHLRTGLAKAGRRRQERLVRDLQAVHLQIAHLPARHGRDALDVIRTAIADRDLIFQLNLARMRGAAGPAALSLPKKTS